MGLFGPPNVDKMVKNKNVRRLIKALAYEKDYRVNQQAAWGLGEIGDVRSIEALIASRNEGKDDLRRVATEVLDKIVESLIIMLTDSSPKDSEAAAETLARIGGDLTVDRLTTVLKENCEKIGKSDVCVQAIEALGRIGGARVVEPLIDALRHGYGRDSGKICAAKALGQIGDRRAVEALIARLQEGCCVLNGYNEGTPIAAAGALGRIGDPRAIEPLIVALGYSSFRVRVAAATSLVQLYQFGRIGETYKRRILSQRGRIAEPHSRKFVDTTWDHISYHYEDLGIALTFRCKAIGLNNSQLGTKLLPSRVSTVGLWVAQGCCSRLIANPNSALH